jgi:hypothetical protein
VAEVPQEMDWGTSWPSPAVAETVMKMIVVHQQSPKKTMKEKEKEMKPWSFLDLSDLKIKHTRYSTILFKIYVKWKVTI